MKRYERLLGLRGEVIGVVVVLVSAGSVILLGIVFFFTGGK